MTDEPHYTLSEAETELARRECAEHGHQPEFIHKFGNPDPERAICSRCGQAWNLIPVEVYSSGRNVTTGI